MLGARTGVEGNAGREMRLDGEFGFAEPAPLAGPAAFADDREAVRRQPDSWVDDCLRICGVCGCGAFGMGALNAADTG
jgi:hypothetical protein